MKKITLTKFLLNLEKVLFFLILILLPTQLGRHFWPMFSYVLGIRIDYLSPTIYITDILIFFLFVFFLFNKFTKVKKTIIFKFKKINQKDLLNIFLKTIIPYWKIVTFISVLFLGIYFSKNFMIGIYGFLKFFEFSFFSFYAFLRIKKIKIKTLILPFLIGVLFEGFLAINQYFNHGSLGGIFYFFGERTFNAQTYGIANALINGELILRPYGTFSHPNVLAGYLLIGMAIIIFNIKLQKPNLKKLIYLISLIAGTVALFLSMSRIVIILWLFILIFFFYLKIKINYKISKLSLSFYALIFILILCFIFVSPLRYRFLNLNMQDESILLRENLIKNSLILFKEHPFFGVGLNNFLPNLAILEKPIRHYSLSYLQPVHNIYLLILVETGVIGFLLFTIFIIKTINQLIKYFKIKNKYTMLTEVRFTSLFIILVIGFFDHYFLTIQQGQLLFSFVLGWCWVDYAHENKK